MLLTLTKEWKSGKLLRQHTVQASAGSPWVTYKVKRDPNRNLLYYVSQQQMCPFWFSSMLRCLPSRDTTSQESSLNDSRTAIATQLNDASSPCHVKRLAFDSWRRSRVFFQSISSPTFFFYYFISHHHALTATLLQLMMTVDSVESTKVCVARHAGVSTRPSQYSFFCQPQIKCRKHHSPLI